MVRCYQEEVANLIASLVALKKPMRDYVWALRFILF